MSKLIVEMEYPNNGCSECRLKYKRRGYGGVFYCFNHLCVDKWTYGRTQNGDRPSWCPIKGVLPEEHGDLIDRDIMHRELQLWKSTATDTTTMCFLWHVEKMLMCIRPNIAAERKDDETTVD